MGLTDVLTLYFFIAISLIVTGAIVLFWRFFSGTGLRKGLIRLTAIALSQVLLLITVGIQINRSNDFYASWSDLFGTSSTYVAQAKHAGTIGLIDKKDLLGGIPIAGKGLLVHDVISEKDSGVSNSVYIALSSEAVKSLRRGRPLDEKKYRVAEFLTGFPSQPLMWISVLRIDHQLAAFNEKNPQHQIIGIFPQVNVAGHYDLECMNLPNDKPAAETWLSSDMHTFINSRLGNLPSRWGVMGVSTGGWCAAMLSTRHPDLYSAAVSIAGYYRPALPLSYPVAIQRKMIVKYDFAQSEANLPRTMPLYLTASAKDIYSFRETSKFLAKSHPHLKITYRELSSGGHNSRVWVSFIPAAFNWLQRNIPV